MLLSSIAFAAILAVIAYAIRVCAQDALRRGKSPWLVTALVLLFFPLGWIIWLLFRPEPIISDMDRPFRLEDHRVQ